MQEWAGGASGSYNSDFIECIFLYHQLFAFALSSPELEKNFNACAARTLGRWPLHRGSRVKTGCDRSSKDQVQYTYETRSNDQGRILRIKNFDPGRKRFHGGTVSDYPLYLLLPHGQGPGEVPEREMEPPPKVCGRYCKPIAQLASYTSYLHSTVVCCRIGTWRTRTFSPSCTSSFSHSARHL